MGRIEDEQRHVQQTSDLHLATIEALARAIDAKDQTTQMHIRRVQVYAAGLAKAVGLSAAEIQGVKTAALLHDIGKLAVPEHILSKPGPLTQEEFQKIRIHPQVGAEIIAAVPFPYPVAPLILSHHERWDGKGYPQGLAGDDIPIGARILTIVDYYDAVTTERPYHKALSHESAIGLLKHEAGRALDPDARADVHRAAAVAARGARRRANRRRRRGRRRRRSRPARPPPASCRRRPATRSRTSRSRTARSTRSTRSRSRWAPASASSTRWRSSRRSCRRSSRGRAARCSSAAGRRHAEVPLRGRRRRAAAAERDARRSATGSPGWVARNRRTLVNADPRVTLRGGRARRATSRSSRRSSARCTSTTRSSAAWRSTTSTPNRYTEDHRRLLERVAEQAGAVIHNSIVFEQTQEDSLTDPLTGLPNRRSMFVHLSRELARAERLKSEVALIVMDIDGFKAINDTYGHHVGDHALREVAAALQGALRPYDLCVRYAGDEFIVVLADCSREAAEAQAPRAAGSASPRSSSKCGPGKQLRLARQRRRRGVPARRRDLRSAARRRRPPHVSRQGRAPRPRCRCRHRRAAEFTATDVRRRPSPADARPSRRSEHAVATRPYR